MSRLLTVSMSLVLHLVAQASVYGQAADTGGRIAAMAGTGVALPAQPWPTVNPAAIGGGVARRIAFQASQGFGMPELQQGGLAVTWPFPLATFSADVHTFGFDAFRTTTTRLSIARPLTDLGGGFIGGASISGHRVSIEGFGSASAITLNLGWLMTPRPGLSIGGSIDNVLGGSWMSDEELRQVARIGAAYSMPFATLAFDLEKDHQADASPRIGVEFPLVRAFRIRTGAATAPTRIAMGAGVHTGGFDVDLAAERHQVLGWTPAISMTLAF